MKNKIFFGYFGTSGLQAIVAIFEQFASSDIKQ